MGVAIWRTWSMSRSSRSFNLRGTLHAPTLARVDVDPARLADWVKGKGASARSPWKEAPMYTYPYGDRIAYPA
eukprot:171414-Pyramimonas_sp.AAC.1